MSVVGTPALPDAHRDDVLAVARSFGIPDREISVAPRQGQVNLTIFLGSELVLRLPRKPRFAQRLTKEAAIIPVVLERGIPTAELVRFDASRVIVDVPYIVLARVNGRTIDDMPSLADGGGRTYGSLCEILSALHQLEMSAQTAIPGVEVAEFSSGSLLDELITSGEIGTAQAVWLRGWFRQLETMGARRSATVLLHGDVMPSNLILAGSGEVSAIIDWGSACWGEAARDLAGFRTSRLPTVVDAYRGVAESASDNLVGLEAGVIWYQLFFALARLLGRPSTSELRNWSAPKEARLLELLRFFTADVPGRWQSLRSRQP